MQNTRKDDWDEDDLDKFSRTSLKLVAADRSVLLLPTANQKLNISDWFKMFC